MRAWGWLLLAPFMAPLAAQEDELWSEVALRVTATAPGGIAVVDRGAADGLARGDVVFFHPREGGIFAGNVIEAGERTARVQLRDPARPLVPGMRAVARVPKSRIQAQPVPPAESPVPAPEQARPPPTEHPGWQRESDDWQPDMPLLSGVEVLRPEERAPRIGGRSYLIGDHIRSFENGPEERTDTFLRLGAEAWMENPFGRGGVLEIDAEQNYRASDLPDGDTDGSDLRLDRFSYAWGGTRFAPERHEAGRFLQHAFPELGVLDGYEWGLRRDNGARFGASAGFMPEPDEDMESGHDFQLATYYEWVADARERLSAGAGYQKTWHDGAADRDLLIGRVQYLPGQESWDFLGTAWVDFYTSGDEAKDSAVELTQANFSTTRRYADGDELGVSYVHMRFPEIDRQEFLPVTLAQLADDHVDRLSLSGWKGVDARRRVHARLGGWIDEDEAGGDTELGLEVEDWLASESVVDGTLFASVGEFSSLYGTRLSYGQWLGRGRWDALYEIGLHDQEGFDEDSDDLLQQRLRASREFIGSAGWSVSGYAETRFYDDEGSLLLGFFAQWSF